MPVRNEQWEQTSHRRQGPMLSWHPLPSIATSQMQIHRRCAADGRSLTLLGGHALVIADCEDEGEEAARS